MRKRPTLAVAATAALAAGSVAAALAGSGFDALGYNADARIFNGLADGVDGVLDGTAYGDPTYGQDRLKMSWSKSWQDYRDGGPLGPDAWIDNQWNGNVKGGSGETWHYRIVWVGSALQDSPHWRPGGVPIWGEFELLMSHGTVANQHFWDVHARPAGFRGPK